MKTLTEFAAITLKNAAKSRQELLTAGKTAEELPAALGEALKLEGDKLTRLLGALEIAEGKSSGDLKRVLVVSLAEGEKAPTGVLEKNGMHFQVEHYPPIGGRGASRDDRDERGGRGGRGDKRGGKHGGRDDKRGGGRGGPGPGRGGERGERSVGGPGGSRGPIAPVAVGEIVIRPPREGGIAPVEGGRPPREGGRPPREGGRPPRGPRGPRRDAPASGIGEGVQQAGAPDAAAGAGGEPRPRKPKRDLSPKGAPNIPKPLASPIRKPDALLAQAESQPTNTEASAGSEQNSTPVSASEAT